MHRFTNPTESDVPDLATMFREGGGDDKKDAAFALGRIGSPACIGPVAAALADDDDYVRSYAMMGIEQGILARQCAPAFLDAAFPALVRLLDRRDESVSGRAPTLLLQIDAERAIPILYSAQYFTTTNHQLHYILEALTRHEKEVPHEKLLPLLAELKACADSYPHDYQYGAALVAYGRNPDNGTESWLRSELTAANRKVRSGSAKGLLIFNGIPDPFRVACDLMEIRGFGRLAPAQQHYFAVTIYGSEVDNGGHSQYFFNSSGNYWKSALLGLRAIGAKVRARVLSRAVAMFEPDDVPKNRFMRIELLDQLKARQPDPFADLDEQFYAAGEDFDVLLLLYAIDNKTHFVPTLDS